MTSRATTRASAAEATVKDEIIAETMKGVSDIVARQGLLGNAMPPIFSQETTWMPSNGWTSSNFTRVLGNETTRLRS